MGYPDGIGAIDLMIGFPFKDKKATYDYLRAGIKDTGDDASVMPAGYMFKETPDEVGDATRSTSPSARWTSGACPPACSA